MIPTCNDKNTRDLNARSPTALHQHTRSTAFKLAAFRRIPLHWLNESHFMTESIHCNLIHHTQHDRRNSITTCSLYSKLLTLHKFSRAKKSISLTSSQTTKKLQITILTSFLPCHRSRAPALLLLVTLNPQTQKYLPPSTSVSICFL
jgi:hypothetical protein